jgi:hypothetical protein
MTTEDRLVDALRSSHDFETSPDLWSRVAYSIEEDRRHRRRVWLAIGIVVLSLVVAIGVAVLSLEASPRDPTRYRIDWRVMEMLEVGVLVVLIGVIGPGIRRFGRGFVEDVFSPARATGDRLSPLLDTAFYLLFIGYVLLTMRLTPPVPYVFYVPGEQIGEAAIRIGGLLLILGVMHAITLIVLPVVALIFNSTRVGAKLPHWVTVLLIVGGIWVLLQLPWLLALIFGAG